MKKPKHNFLISISRVFLFNCNFLLANIITIKDDLKIHTLLIKMFAQFYNYNVRKYFTMQDLHNAYTKIY